MEKAYVLQFDSLGYILSLPRKSLLLGWVFFYLFPYLFTLKNNWNQSSALPQVAENQKWGKKKKKEKMLLTNILRNNNRKWNVLHTFSC